MTIHAPPEMASETEHRAAKAQVKLAKSAEKLSGSATAQEESADRRTILAANRTVLAAERTYAAWVRTGLAALASGIGARALLDGVVHHALVGATGSALILFSAFCFVAAVWREMAPDVNPVPETKRIPAALLIAINGFLSVVSLAALVGIWIR